MKVKDLLAQLEHTQDRLWSFDTDLICTFVNSNMSNDFLQAFQVKLEVGTHMLHNVPEPICSTWQDRYARALEGEQFTLVDHFEIPGVAEYIEVSFNPIIEDGEVTGVACNSKDISIQKNAEINLSTSEASLNAQIENTTDSIWSIDLEYRIVTMNSVFENGFELVFGARLKKNDIILDPLPDEMTIVWKGRYDRAIAGEQFSVVDTFGEGESISYVEISYNPVKVGNETIGVACFTRDITALKKSEIAKQEVVKSRDKFFSIIAHDLRGPISNIKELSGLLTKDDLVSKENKLMIELLAKSSNSVYDLLENLLKWSMTQRQDVTLNKESVNLHELVEASIEPYKLNAQLKNIRLENQIDVKHVVHVDQPSISSVVSNLFSNATKFTGHEGKITLSSQRVNGDVVLSILDDGIGMNTVQLEALFDAQSNDSTPGTNAEKGAGLGLTICNEFVKLNEGKLEATSIEGQGSSFMVTLPSA